MFFRYAENAQQCKYQERTVLPVANLADERNNSSFGPSFPFYKTGNLGKQLSAAGRLQKYLNVYTFTVVSKTQSHTRKRKQKGFRVNASRTSSD